MAPVKTVVPVPINVIGPEPENTPESVAEAEVGLWITPPALVMAIDTLELSPLFSTKVPPARTGFAVTPKALNPTEVPEVTSEIVVPPPPLLPLVQMLQAVMVKFQMPDPDAVSLKTKV